MLPPTSTGSSSDVASSSRSSNHDDVASDPGRDYGSESPQPKRTNTQDAQGLETSPLSRSDLPLPPPLALPSRHAQSSNEAISAPYPSLPQDEDVFAPVCSNSPRSTSPLSPPPASPPTSTSPRRTSTSTAAPYGPTNLLPLVQVPNAGSRRAAKRAVSVLSDLEEDLTPPARSPARRTAALSSPSPPPVKPSRRTPHQPLAPSPTPEPKTAGRRPGRRATTKAKSGGGK
jgi:hypothetical protein